MKNAFLLTIIVLLFGIGSIGVKNEWKYPYGFVCGITVGYISMILIWLEMIK